MEGVESMNIEEEFDNFIEFPTGSKEFVTTVSTILFAKHCVAKLEKEIERLWDTIEDIQHSRCPQCRRVKGVGESECTYCGWDVRR